MIHRYFVNLSAYQLEALPGKQYGKLPEISQNHCTSSVPVGSVGSSERRRAESHGEGGRSGGRKAVVQGGVPRMRPLRLRVVVVRRLRFFVVLVFSPFGVACAVNVVLLSGM